MPDIYRQVELVRRVDEHDDVSVVWVPANLAKLGKRLKVRDGGGGSDGGADGWINGYKVTAVYGAQTFDEIQIQRNTEKRWADCLGK